MPKYKLLTGVHSLGKDEKQVDVFAYAGDVFESDQSDLEKLNVDGCPKRFDRVSNSTSVSISNPMAEEQDTPTQADVEQQLTAKSVKELKQLAEEEEVSLEGLTTKPAIVAHLLNTLAPDAIMAFLSEASPA